MVLTATLYRHTKLHYTTLHYTTLHCTALHYTALHYTTLHYTTLHYTTLHDTTLYLHCTTRKPRVSANTSDVRHRGLGFTAVGILLANFAYRNDPYRPNIHPFEQFRNLQFRNLLL